MCSILNFSQCNVDNICLIAIVSLLQCNTRATSVQSMCTANYLKFRYIFTAYVLFKYDRSVVPGNTNKLTVMFDGSTQRLPINGGFKYDSTVRVNNA